MSTHAGRALRLLERQDHVGARQMLAAPSDADDYAVLGMLELTAEHWSSAREHLLQACVLGDVSPATSLNLALAEDRLDCGGRPRMRRLAERHPTWDEPWLRLAESYRRAGSLPDTVAAYERALECNPDRIDALLGLAVTLLGSGEAGAAQVLLLRCCGVNPAVAEAWDALGVALMHTDDPARAESAFARAQQLRPGSLTIALRRIDAAVTAGSADAELARLAQELDREPLNIVALTARGILLDRVGRADESAEILEATVLLAPDAPLQAAALASSLLHAGRFLAAARLFNARY
jgi:tetratricopeptide (TPR) repeat protein